ncbi:MAG: hypothetical protein LUQ16_07480 [Methanomassiliicoccales archaeon]|nr:hypothetical protein [Methanomassiliicoccales archaeon]
MVGHVPGVLNAALMPSEILLRTIVVDRDSKHAMQVFYRFGASRDIRETAKMLERSTIGGSPFPSMINAYFLDNPVKPENCTIYK